MKAIKILALTLGVVLAVGILLSVTGLGGSLFFMAFTTLQKPDDQFEAANTVAAPNYSLPENWAALPDMDTRPAS